MCVPHSDIHSGQEIAWNKPMVVNEVMTSSTLFLRDLCMNVDIALDQQPHI